MSDPKCSCQIYIISCYLCFLFVRGYEGGVPLTKCQPDAKSYCSGRGAQLLCHATSPTIYSKHSKTKKYKTITNNRDIGILSLTSVYTWEGNVIHMAFNCSQHDFFEFVVFGQLDNSINFQKYFWSISLNWLGEGVHLTWCQTDLVWPNVNITHCLFQTFPNINTCKKQILIFREI